MAVPQIHKLHLAYAQKRSTLIATLKKVDAMASDPRERFESACDKLEEFAAFFGIPNEG